MRLRATQRGVSAALVVFEFGFEMGQLFLIKLAGFVVVGALGRGDQIAALLNRALEGLEILVNRLGAHDSVSGAQVIQIFV